METALASHARLVAFEDAAPIVLHDVEDLHASDLDAVLADMLADAYTVADMAAALALLVGLPGPAALNAHALGSASAQLAVH